MNSPERVIPASKCVADQSTLLVVDIQVNLGKAMPAKVLNRVISNSTLLSNAAGLLDVPVYQTEQYPRGLGPTINEVADALPSATQRYEKTCFSSLGADGFKEDLAGSGRQQIVVVGMESHVCVLQSAIDLSAAGMEVFVVEDAICSRRLENYQNALDRLRQANIAVVSAESVVFEWLNDAKHAQFKTIQAMLR